MNRFDQADPRFHGICPKYGKPIMRTRVSGWAKWLFPLIGVLSLLWFLIRVLPKPSRASYPCQRAAMPLASSFVLWLLSMGGCAAAFRHARQKMLKARFALGGVMFVLGVGAAILSIAGGPNGIAGAFYQDTTGGEWHRQDGPNAPMGVGRGMHPGRVAWVYDPAATNGDVTWDNTNGFFWDENHCLQSEVNTMMPKAIRYLTGDQTETAAWNSIFHYFNRNHNKGDIGYQSGEKIAIKINCSATLDFSNPLLDSNQTGHGNDDQGYKVVNPDDPNNAAAITALYQLATNDSDPTPQAIISLLHQFVDVAGVPQQDIYIGDPIRPFTDYLYTRCHAAYPNVHYLDSIGKNGRELATYTQNPVMFYSGGQFESIDGGSPIQGQLMSDQVADFIYHADYFINFALLKREGTLGATLCTKNTYGTMNRSPAHLHNYTLCDANGDEWGKYNALVDHMGNQYLGGKTLLYVVDGLFGGWWSNGAWSMPEKWQSMPVNGQPWWPSSLLVSQDPVAIDSVGLDFLAMETSTVFTTTDPNIVPGIANCADNYLHEAAQADNPPSGTVYDPNRTGTHLPSLGVHEHWNDPVHKQYTRNLGTGQGIELVSSPTTSISISAAAISRGQTGVVKILMNAQGTESAVGFSLNFDPTQLQYVSSTLGAAAASAYYMENDNNTVNGQVGFGLMMQPIGSSFPAGALSILEVTFKALTGSGTVSTPLTFGDNPVTRQVADAAAMALPTIFTDGTVTVNGLLTVFPAAGAHGTITPNTPQPVNYNGSVNFTANPASGYVVDSWTVDTTVAQSEGTQFTLSSITANHNVTVSFKPAFSLTVLTVTPPSPLPANTPITLALSASGGANVQYQFWVYNATATPAWSQLQGYSTTASYIWTPKAPGSYLISGTAKDGSTGTELNKTLWYTVTNPPLTSVTLTTTPTSPRPVNTPITLTATAIGGTNVTYQFWAYNPAANPTWSQLRAYAASASYQWTPTAPGSYYLVVTARDGLIGTLVTKALWYTVNGAPLSGVSVASSPTSPQPANTPITFTATTTGGSNLQYQFYLYNATATPAWSPLQAYSTSNVCTWTPLTPGSYYISVTAKDGLTGMVANKTFWYTITTPLTGVSVASSPLSPQPANTPITFTATPIGGTNVTYQFWAYNSAATPAWTQLQAYSSRAACPWKPAASGSYYISVTARDGITGKEVNKCFWYTVK